MTADGSAPLVSVVIITYNQREFIEECLESVLTQDLSGPWEVIVADDASTDGTTEYLMELAESHPRLRVLTTPNNLGAQRNLRRALNAATGEFVATLEGDDYWTGVSKLRLQVERLRSNPRVAALGHLTEVVSPDGHLPYRADFDGRDHLAVDEVVRSTFPHVSSLMFRRDRLPSTPMWFDGLRGADWLMCCLLADPDGIDLLRVPMSHYRVNAESTWAPLPFAERKLDTLRQLHALRANTSLLSSETYRESARKTYSALYSGIAKTPRAADKARLARAAFKVSPTQAFMAGPAWMWAQIRKRI